MQPEERDVPSHSQFLFLVPAVSSTFFALARDERYIARWLPQASGILCLCDNTIPVEYSEYLSLSKGRAFVPPTSSLSSDISRDPDFVVVYFATPILV
jgi:hypothetical protein